jgi:hypothetical protein
LQSAWEKVLTQARIGKFRWHDLRHYFASRLVQKGVPLNTVRDLLGHGSVGMSLRYAHLAPDQRREAVAKLNEKPLLTLTMRLRWEGIPMASSYRHDSIVIREGLELASQVAPSGNLPAWELRLISAFENAWISTSRAKKRQFLRLPCAYGAEAESAGVAISLI